MAAKLFAVQTWVSVTCGLLLLLLIKPKSTPNFAVADVEYAYGAIIFVVTGVLLALLVTFGVSPRIVARENLMLWHAVGSAMYVLQWVCTGVVLYKLANHNPNQD